MGTKPVLSRPRSVPGRTQLASPAFQPLREARHLTRGFHFQTQVHRTTAAGRNSALPYTGDRVIEEFHHFLEPGLNLKQRFFVDFHQKSPALEVIAVGL